MLDSDKIYDFTVTFGEETDSLDLEGQVIATSDARPTLSQIEAILSRFTGSIEQAPPAYSALKVDGRRSYDLARAGEEVVLAPRDVTIHALSLHSSLNCPGEELANVTLTAHVSKGTYIRSLARDVALALGTVGHVTMLRRTKAGPFTLEQAISLDILMEKAKARALEDITLPIRTALDDIPALALTPEQARLLHNGQVLTGIAAQGGLHLALNGEIPLALVEVLDGNVRTVRRFNL
jgi:tRNA pseudouridine55 synthase